ncbi:dihydrolipoamide acetyltransferase family protein [Dolosigranulum pigrum]|uniref:dihydrolipoamide acetyltransferase family protein n=1 Tax=Dolosigranulum pigrum TaxID=29394 RepID=UPI001AD88E27|nr:dihydrolipoamide acetyltransferase family protein [Dolosigranulum pigrum]QTJ55292.1 2-oxo acid dehydrogenase subunit E2 [Dolosigranulum pigrum]
MVYTLKLPRLGEGLFEAQVVNILANKGASVTEDTIIADMQTDKAAGELQSPVEGKVVDILMKEGEFVYQGDPLVLIDDGSDTPPDLSNDSGVYRGPSGVDGSTVKANSTPSEKKQNNQSTRSIDKVPETTSDLQAGKHSLGKAQYKTTRRAKARSTEPEQDQTQPPRSMAEQPNTTPQLSAAEKERREFFAQYYNTDFELQHDNVQEQPKKKVQAMPYVRAYARQLGIDLTQINQEGDIVKKEDIETLKKQNAIEKSVYPFKPVDQYAPLYSSTREDEQEEIELSYIRKWNASAYEMQHRIVPPFTLFEEVDASALLAMMDDYERDGIELDSYLPFVVKAVVAAAEKFPRLNASLDDSVATFVQKDYCSVGIDVNTVQGMFTPVIHDAQQKSLETIQETIKQLSKDVQTRTFEWDNLSEGTITITDCSNISSKVGHFTPMIHYPQSACLGLGTIEDKPVIYEGEVVAQPTLPLSLTVDYRVVDRKDAFAAMAFLKELLEHPNKLLFQS